MRDVSQAVIDAMTTTRQIGGRMVVRDNHLIFSEKALDDEAVMGNIASRDVDAYQGLLRVA